MTVPSQFVGAWKRVSLALGDGPPSEDSHVVWVQSDERYADVRVGPRPDAFAGTADWDGETMTWHHEIDVRPGRPPDRGRLTFDHDFLVERGDGYVEVWQRIGPPSPASVSSARSSALVDGVTTEVASILVEVGGHAVRVASGPDGVDAEHRQRDPDGSWSVVVRLP